MFTKFHELPQNSVAGNRKRCGYTQEQLAKKVGVSRQTIISIEKGNYTPSITLALKLAHTLKTPLESLFWILPS